MGSKFAGFGLAVCATLSLLCSLSIATGLERPVGNIPNSPTDFRPVDETSILKVTGHWPVGMQAPPHSLQSTEALRTALEDAFAHEVQLPHLMCL